MLLKAMSGGTKMYKTLQLRENNQAILGYMGYLIKWKMCIDFERELQDCGPVGLNSTWLRTRRRVIASVREIELEGNGIIAYS